jgi:hypothetical protein
MVDLKYVGGLIVGFFVAKWILDILIGPIVAGTEGRWVIGRWKPFLDRTYQSMSPSSRQEMHQTLAQNPQAMQYLHESGIDW